MLTSSPRLRIRRPSPTTAEFTVTTLPPQTVTLRVLRMLLLALRVTLALLTLVVVHARFTMSSSSSSASPAAAAIEVPLPGPILAAHVFLCRTLYGSAGGAALWRLAAGMPLALLVPGAAAVAYVLALRVHTSESLLVLRGLGVQTTRSPSTYLVVPGASAATRFIPTEKIRDVLVNEAFLGFEVRYYLVVVVEGEADVVVVFPSLLPKREIVETVWRGARECLYEAGKPSVQQSSAEA